jgi:hypothetical protein
MNSSWLSHHARQPDMVKYILLPNHAFVKAARLIPDKLTSPSGLVGVPAARAARPA